MLDMNDVASNLINLEIVVDHDLKLNPHGLGFGRNIFFQKTLLLETEVSNGYERLHSLIQRFIRQERRSNRYLCHQS